MPTHNFKDITNEKYGHLLVMELSKSQITADGKKHTYWKCMCNCGNITIVESYKLRSGHTKSCGCLKKKIKHGYSRHKLYKKWSRIKDRCCNPNSQSYKDYGARGIKICDEWKNNPEEFIKWSLENGWKEGLDIDRIDNNGNYSPENCRFITRRKNVLNQRVIRNNNKTGYRGVSWHSQVKKWRAYIVIDGKQKHLGLFNSKLNAALAYNEIAEEEGYPLNNI